MFTTARKQALFSKFCLSKKRKLFFQINRILVGLRALKLFHSNQTLVKTSCSNLLPKMFHSKPLDFAKGHNIYSRKLCLAQLQGRQKQNGHNAYKVKTS